LLLSTVILLYTRKHFLEKFQGEYDAIFAVFVKVSR
jgi:hypothetical protein